MQTVQPKIVHKGPIMCIMRRDLILYEMEKNNHLYFNRDGRHLLLSGVPLGVEFGCYLDENID